MALELGLAEEEANTGLADQQIAGSLGCEWRPLTAVARHRGEEMVLELVLHAPPQPLGEGCACACVAR